MAAQKQGFSASDILTGAGDALTGVGDVASSLKKISTEGFPVNIRIETNTLILFCIAIIVTSTIAGSLTALAEGAIKKAFI